MPAEQTEFIDTIHDIFPSPVFFIDTNGLILSANSAALEHFGYAADEIIGGSARRLYASDRDFAAARADHEDEGLRFSEHSHHFRRRDGTIFTARLRTAPVADASGVSRGIACVLHGMADTLAFDPQSMNAGEMLETALQAIPEGFAIFDSEERIIVYNDAYRRICGSIGAKLRIGMTAEDIIKAVYEAGHYPSAPKGAEEGALWIENRLRDFRNPAGDNQIFQFGDGRWLRVEDFKTKDGNTVALRIDVTTLKQAERALDRQRLEYYTLVQNIPDFIWRVSPDLRFTFVNERYAGFVDRAAAELIGRPALDFVLEKDRDRLVAVLRGLTPENPVASREQHRKMPDGSDLWIFWSNIALFDGARLVEYITVGRDITELKLQQQRIAQQSAELLRKNEALHQFTGTVSHDLKAPLRHMSMFSEMIAEDVASGHLDELSVYAGHLRQSARRMDQLIDSLLEYAQIADQIDNWQTVSIAEVVADAALDLDSFIQEAEARFELSDLPEVMGDPELLKRLCQNLIGNAIKYRKEDVKPVIRIYAEAGDGCVRICFEDNGIGIDPRFAKKVFDVFQRLHRDETTYQGTGIGLALAKRIAESHNGSIELDTAFTQGARFILVLPEMKQLNGK